MTIRFGAKSASLAAGWLVSFCGDILGGVAAGLIALGKMTRPRGAGSYSAADNQLYHVLLATPPSMIIQLVAQAFFSFLGAFVAVHIAKSAPWQSVRSLVVFRLFVFALCAALAGLAAIYSVWFLLATALLMTVFACAGGWWRIATRRHEAVDGVPLPSRPPIPPVPPMG